MEYLFLFIGSDDGVNTFVIEKENLNKFLQEYYPERDLKFTNSLSSFKDIKNLESNEVIMVKGNIVIPEKLQIATHYKVD